MPRHAQSPADLPDQATVLSMPGLDYMRAMLEGRLPEHTIGAVMNFHLDLVAPGHVRFRGTPLFQHTNPFGALHGGWYGTLLDSALAGAVMTMVPQGRWYTTLEYKVNITRALAIGVEVVAEAHTAHCGRSTGVSTAELRGVADGRLYATGSTTCIILE
ncbi:PaaI family thioesterase [Fertoebacter nigrum]|uniref:PaaI family thioesterase n=1 Tax=Fertoeibacter niger TaxID=2656921 RepID=A0A8X8KQ66_9RHOB|nr:PaaI family thioesterase [Fertoeibacter niger]NUB43732.1 PaaI family thioesterase [Fertoeibacter niger]